MEAKIVTTNTGSLPLPGQGAPLPSQVQTGAPDIRVTPTKETFDSSVSQQNQERDRLAAVKLAAKSFNYPLGDKKFTIYKDKGQYITRFTSLRDGSVSYYPEPELLKGRGAGVLFEFDV